MASSLFSPQLGREEQAERRPEIALLLSQRGEERPAVVVSLSPHPACFSLTAARAGELASSPLSFWPAAKSTS
jgi:hypothetical protein